MMFFRQNDNQFNVFVKGEETLDGVHQQRSPFEKEKLLRNDGSHPLSASACNYDTVLFHPFPFVMRVTQCNESSRSAILSYKDNA